MLKIRYAKNTGPVTMCYIMLINMKIGHEQGPSQNQLLQTAARAHAISAV